MVTVRRGRQPRGREEPIESPGQSPAVPAVAAACFHDRLRRRAEPRRRDRHAGVSSRSSRAPTARIVDGETTIRHSSSARLCGCKSASLAAAGEPCLDEQREAVDAASLDRRSRGARATPRRAIRISTGRPSKAPRGPRRLRLPSTGARASRWTRLCPHRPPPRRSLTLPRRPRWSSSAGTLPFGVCDRLRAPGFSSSGTAARRSCREEQPVQGDDRARGCGNRDGGHRGRRGAGNGASNSPGVSLGDSW